MTSTLSAYDFGMPKRGQKRDLPKEMREVVAKNVNRLMEKSGLTSSNQLAKAGKIGRKTADRLRLGQRAVQLDTIEAVASALGVQPFELLIKTTYSQSRAPLVQGGLPAVRESQQSEYSVTARGKRVKKSRAP